MIVLLYMHIQNKLTNDIAGDRTVVSPVTEQTTSFFVVFVSMLIELILV